MAAFDNAELLQDIRDRGSLPSDDLRFTNTRLLASASLELRDTISPLMVESQTERGVHLSDVAVTAGVSEYRLPSRALGARFKSLGWKTTGNTKFTRLHHFSADAYYLQGTDQGTPVGFFLRDNVVVLVPTPNVTGTLRVPYYLRPSTLVVPESAAVAVLVSEETNTVDISAEDATLFGSSAVVDVVRATPGFETLAMGVPVTIEDGGGPYIVTFTEGLPAGMVAGDYICEAGLSPVPQCPVEVRGLLAARAARRALKSVNEGNLASMLDADVAELTETARNLLAPRADAEPQEWGDVSRGLLYGLLGRR